MGEKQYYVSRDGNKKGAYSLWKDDKPEWLWSPRWFIESGSCESTIFETTQTAIEIIAPQLHLEPGQLAKVNREVKDGVVTLTLGEIIESH